jgi:hypothetical protein
MTTSDHDLTRDGVDHSGGTGVGAVSARDRSLVVAAAVGSGLGVFSVLADGVIASRALVILGNIISPWAVAAFVVGRFARSWQRGGRAGSLALLLGVAVYYVGQGVRIALGGDDPLTDLAFSAVPLVWLVAAVTVGPALGVAGAASKRHGPLHLVAIGLPCVVLLAEAGFLVVDRRPWLWDLVAEPHRLTDLVLMVGLVALAVAIPIRTVAERRPRLLVYGVALVTAAAGSVALVGLYRLLVHFA